MKKIFSIIVTILLFNQLNAQVVSEGSTIQELYLGYNPMIMADYKALNGGDITLREQFQLLNFGYRYESLKTDKFGLGATFNYHTNQSGLMVNGNYHFIDNEYLDVFATAGIGVGISKLKIAQSVNDKISEFLFAPYFVGAGIRYYAAEDLGVVLNGGYRDGGIITIGISYRANY
jgi:opacity protein-like surface antigen